MTNIKEMECSAEKTALTEVKAALKEILISAEYPDPQGRRNKHLSPQW